MYRKKPLTSSEGVDFFETWQVSKQMFEQVKLLPREKQKFVLQFLDTVLNSNQQKA
jgi:hypothetical protein